MRANVEGTGRKRGRPRKSEGGGGGGGDKGADDDDDGEGGRKKSRLRSAVGEDGTWRPHLPLKR